MKNFNVDARQVKSAMTMQAKNDARYYLNGVLIGGGEIVATDGHRLIVVDSPKSTFKPTIFLIKGSLPKSAIDCEFVFIGDDYGVVMSKNARGQHLNAVVKFVIVDGKFPNYKKVMPKGDPSPVLSVGFNVGYVADVNKAATALGCELNHGKFSFYDDGRKAVIEITAPENKAICIIMGTRI